MIKDKHDVNRLIGMLENVYGQAVPVQKIAEVNQFIDFQRRTLDPNRDLGRVKIRDFNLQNLRKYSADQIKKCPHLNPDLYDSPVEYGFATLLHDSGLVWTPRHQAGKYRLDFAFLNEMVDVEIDGVLYHGLPDQQRRDDFRDKYLNGKGWLVLRISAYDAQMNGHQKINNIKTLLAKRSQLKALGKIRVI